ncbi:MAG: SDR family NAD(P)-dependent oxidoreductase [Isosphaeraceae bacterium]|nr:SDR family NAD(P)-dependent oxidoreductase [Isosphaeraceae bacterium]
MIHALFDLTGRVAVVTGAARGLGRAMALAFAEAGASLVLVDRDTEGAHATAAEAATNGHRAVAMAADVSDPKALQQLFESVDREFGRVDILGNVAGDGVLGRPEELTIAQVEEQFRNLVIGRFAACQEAGRRMLAAGKGTIINIGSLASITALGRGHVAYSMAMGAVAQMTRELSTEWAARGVRVNAILPAQVLNPGLAHRMAQDPGLEATFLRGIPAGRLGRPEDIQGLALFLASDASSWITGALIPMDGGNLAVNAGGTVGQRLPR